MTPIACIFVFAAAPGSAQADTLEATRGQPLVEASHIVDATVEDGLVHLEVIRSFENRGGETDQIELEIILPDQATATGLAIKAGKKWYEGELMEAQMATVMYQSLTGMGPFKPKDPALLEWTELGELVLWVFPVFAQSTNTIRYDLTIAPDYRDGYYWFEYPASPHAADLMAPRIKVSSDAKGKILINGIESSQKSAVTLYDPAEKDDLPMDWCGLDTAHEWGQGGWDLASPTSFCLHKGKALIRVPAPPISTVEVRYGNFGMPTGRSIVRLEVDTAPVLRKAPKKASVVFVIDASRSWGKEGIDGSLALAAAYMAHVPDARVQVVLFRREAVALLPDLVKSTGFVAALSNLDPAALAPGNGSRLEAGLELASALLEKRKGPRRIVAITDTVMASRFAIEDAQAALGDPEFPVHVVDLTAELNVDDVICDRQDDHDLAPIATDHGGILVDISGGNTPSDFETASLELVRPVRIDKFAIHEKSSTMDAYISTPDALDEGRGLRYFTILDESPEKVTLSGEIWSTPWSVTIDPDPGWGADVVPALVFGSELFAELDDIETLSAAASAGAVSPLTSYLAIEPGVRPSTDGFDADEAFGMGGLGTIGFGGGGGGYGIGYGSSPQWAAMLTKIVRDATLGCAGKDPSIVRVETTYSEIVDVKVMQSSDAVASHCIEEAVWSATLPDSFTLSRFSLDIEV